MARAAHHAPRQALSHYRKIACDGHFTSRYHAAARTSCHVCITSVKTPPIMAPPLNTPSALISFEKLNFGGVVFRAKRDPFPARPRPVSGVGRDYTIPIPPFAIRFPPVARWRAAAQSRRRLPRKKANRSRDPRSEERRAGEKGR